MYQSANTIQYSKDNSGANGTLESKLWTPESNLKTSMLGAGAVGLRVRPSLDCHGCLIVLARKPIQSES